jgi:hypothetical protein
MLGPGRGSCSTAIPDTVVRFKVPVMGADITPMGKGATKVKYLGPATVVKPCLMGAAVLLAIQTAMAVFLKA